MHPRARPGRDNLSQMLPAPCSGGERSYRLPNLMRGSWVALVAVLAARSATSWAAAEGLGHGAVTLEVSGACPDVVAVRRLLAALVSPPEERAVAVSIQDQGNEYRIAVGAEVTTLADPTRDCAARARQ